MEIESETRKKGDKRQLRSPEDLRLFMASLIKQVREGKLDESKGRCLTYMVQTLLNIIRENDLEKRIEEIENRIRDGIR